MGLKVYGVVLAGSCQLVLAALGEKGVSDYELVHVDMMKGAHKKPDYLALQPFGQVPVLVDGPLTLFAIARYIENKFEGEGTPLYGSMPFDRALVEQWLEVHGQNFSPAVAGIASEKYGKLFTGQEPDEAVVLAGFEKWGRVLDAYEARLTDNKYLAGDFFSLADLAHLPHLNTLISILKLGENIIEASRQVLVGRHFVPPSLEKGFCCYRARICSVSSITEGKMKTMAIAKLLAAYRCENVSD